MLSIKLKQKMPYGGKQIKETYYNEQISDLKDITTKMWSYINIIETNSTHLDDKYFLRG